MATEHNTPLYRVYGFWLQVFKVENIGGTNYIVHVNAPTDAGPNPIGPDHAGTFGKSLEEGHIYAEFVKFIDLGRQSRNNYTVHQVRDITELGLKYAKDLSHKFNNEAKANAGSSGARTVVLEKYLNLVFNQPKPKAITSTLEF